MQCSAVCGQWPGSAAEVNVQKPEPKIKEAASQFEALLIGQMLKQFREADAGEGGDQAGVSMLEIAEGQLAQVLAARGGLGLAQIIIKGLSRRD
jgi:flagellar protein FlgJ